MEQFESIKKTLPPDDVDYRLAQELSGELRFSYDSFLPFIENAIFTCRMNGCDVSSHFLDIGEDFQLSQYACYLTIEKLPISDEIYHKQIKDYFYTKDFTGWHLDKQRVNDGFYEPKEGKRYTNEREIWNSKRGINIGNETDGKGKYLRPVLVLKSFGSLCLVVPLTKQGKMYPHRAAHRYHKITSVNFPDNKGINIDSFIMLNQIKVVDKKRLIEKKAIMGIEEFNITKNLLKDMYFPEDS